jgi:hypothetical protein
LMEEGTGNDYVINNNDISFEFALTLSMKIVVLYKSVNIV